MRLQIVTPDRAVLDEEVDEVYAPGANGEFGVLPEHVTFLTSLDIGVLRYRAGGKDEFVAIAGGVTEVLDDVVTILADSAEKRDEIDLERAQKAAAAASEGLEKPPAATPEHDDSEAALRRARNRESVAAL